MGSGWVSQAHAVNNFVLKFAVIAQAYRNLTYRELFKSLAAEGNYLYTHENNKSL
jgi:hypothetical protein